MTANIVLAIPALAVFAATLAVKFAIFIAEPPRFWPEFLFCPKQKIPSRTRIPPFYRAFIACSSASSVRFASTIFKRGTFGPKFSLP